MQSFLDMDVRLLLPIITLGNVLNTLFNLQLQGIEPKIEKLLVPAVIGSFGGPLIGNLIYKQFVFSTDLLIIFFMSLLVFPIVCKSAYIKKFVKIFPMIGTSLFYVGLKNNKQDLTSIIAYLVISDVFSKLFLKILTNKNIDYDIEDVKQLSINIAIICVFKYFEITDLIAFTIVFCNTLRPQIKFNNKIIKKNKAKFKNIKDVPLTYSPDKKKRPVRRTSIVSLA